MKSEMDPSSKAMPRQQRRRTFGIYKCSDKEGKTLKWNFKFNLSEYKLLYLETLLYASVCKRDSVCVCAGVCVLACVCVCVCMIER